MQNSKAFSAASATSPLALTTIVRRDPTDHDVQIEILFCGVCHSDLHQARNEWSGMMPTVYPCVPGHEIVGRVTKVGFGGAQIQGRRSCGCRLPCRLGRILPRMQSRTRAVLSEHHADLQLSRQTSGRSHLRRLLGQHCCRPEIRPSRPLEPESRRSRSVAVRRDHHVLALRHWGVAAGKKVGVVGLEDWVTWA